MDTNDSTIERNGLTEWESISVVRNHALLNQINIDLNTFTHPGNHSAL